MSCDRRGPLTRSGHAQPDRDIRERDPAYFRLDERDTADLILFARRFAKHLRYYDSNNSEAGDWSAFFDNDVSTTLASLVKAPVDTARRTLADLRHFLEDDPGRGEGELKSHFSLLFHLPVALYRDVADRQAALETEHPLYPILQRLAARDIGPTLADLARYHRGAVDAGVFDDDVLLPSNYSTTGNAGPGPRLPDEIAALVLLPAPEATTFPAIPLARRAIRSFAPDGWTVFYNAQGSDGAPYADGENVYEQVYDALNYNLLVAAMERLFQAMARVQEQAAAHLRASLTDFAAHRPHYGLWLAFLAMFDRAREELNDFTARHLDFYYEEVLRLGQRPPVADHVHVLAELARGRDAHLLAAGTELRGGKDALGRDVVYALDDDIVVNRAAVAELRGVRVDEARVNGLPLVTVRAASVLASLDGAGEQPLPAEQPRFPPFGPTAAPTARVGFAVADRQLFQRDGERLILLSFTQPVPGLLLDVPGFRARLTTEDGWLELDARPAFQVSLGFGRLWFVLRLSGGDPPVVGVDPAVHGTDYDADLPVLEILVAFEDPPALSSAVFAFLRDLERGPCLLQTSATGQRLMSVRTEAGTADPAAAFTPFGPQPRVGGQWIIGSREVFGRSLNSLSIRVTWARRYDSSSYFRDLPAASYTVGLAYLANGAWTAVPETSALVIDATGEAVINAAGLAAAASNADPGADDPPFDTAARSGFLRMTLQEDFGHASFPRVQTRALIARANPWDPEPYEVPAGYNAPEPDRLPLEPYVPEVTGIRLDYQSKECEAARSYRIHPFGSERADGAGRLFPALDYSGALFVGVRDLDPPQRLSLLLQVADGSGDPLLSRPRLEYAWLGRDGWMPFTSQDVDDRTDSLARSGILSVAIPRDAVADSAQMPGRHHWLRIAAPDNGGAVNSLLSVDAQAVRASFVPRDNDPAFLEAPLAANTISKLREAQPAIKALTQPYASFGGRGEEDRPAFRRRASERLRHKARAVTLWDHEHLVLEAFPAVYRVKALQHTEIVRREGKASGDNELAPGAVTVVAVPYTKGREHIDPLRPYADQATLAAIEETLKKRCSPFVRLEAANPRFEEVHVAMSVAFIEGIADTDFYRAQIEATLIEHLTPWRRREARGAEFNGRIYKSAVINVVEELPYVDFLQDVRLYHRPDPEAATWTKVDAEVLRARTARSILVSAPGHEIGLIA